MFNKFFRAIFVLMLVIGLVAVQAPSSAHAAGPWYVATTGDDSNDCLNPSTPCATINGAIGKATSGDIIYVAIGTYIGTGYHVVNINKDLTLSGGWDPSFTIQVGMSAIDGQSSRGGISNVGDARLERFVIENSFHTFSGGGITNRGTLTISHSIIRNNVSGQGGGGIYSAGPLLVINNSLIQNNSTIITGWGGGIFHYGALIINNSTISGNKAAGNGGGIYSYSGVVTINNTTISNNESSTGGGIYDYLANIHLNNTTISDNLAFRAGGLYYNGTFTIENTIVAENRVIANYGPDCEGFGLLESLGNNLISDISDCVFASLPNDFLDVDPLLGPLQNNGGLTFTHALLPGSPAIDAGNNATCEATDQRGVTRPQGAACDIGAFEYELAMIDVYIDIKPGSDTNPINLNSRGKIPVAILSTVDFDAPSMLDTTSLTFGKTGDEASLAFCNNGTEDVNGDGLLDLVCHFYTQATGFQIGDLEGVLKGETVEGTPLEGRDVVTILD